MTRERHAPSVPSPRDVAVPVSVAAMGTAAERTAQDATLVRAARPQRRTRPASPLPRRGGPQSRLRRSAHPATPGQHWALSWVLQVPGQVQEDPFKCTDQDTNM